jgi:hypothetical protein
MAKIKPRISTRQRVVGDFQFSDNQLQRVLGEMRQAVQHLQGYIGATEQLLTIEELQILIQELINNSPGGGTGNFGGIPEAPEDGILYGRKDATWQSVIDEVGSGTSDHNIDGGTAGSVYLPIQLINGGKA